MANVVTIEAEARADAGKGAARATRRQGLVPAVIYGAKQPSALISLDPRIVMREVSRSGWRSRLYEVKFGDQTERALIREVQWHKVTDKPEHVDFQRLAPGEKMRVAVSVVFANELLSPGLKRGGVLNIVRHAVECFVDPDNVPAHFTAELTGLEINENIRWSDLKGTEGVKPVIQDRDFVIASVASTKGMEAAAAEAAPAAAGKAAPAKGKAAPAKAAPAKAAPAKPAAKK
jgi:large subunit ribosomal protein L25